VLQVQIAQAGLDAGLGDLHLAQQADAP